MLAHAHGPASIAHHHNHHHHHHHSSMPSTSSPTHSSPSSTSSSGSALRYSALSIGSGNSGSWGVGSDGTAATSDGGSPAPTLAQQGSVLKGAVTSPRAPSMLSTSTTPTSTEGDVGSERLRKCASTPSLRGPLPTSAVKRKASAGSSSAQAESLESIRKEEMRRVTPEPAVTAVEADSTQANTDNSSSPDASRKLRRKKETDADDSKRRRRKRGPRSVAVPIEVEVEEPEEHIDLATYPQEELLRLVASLLTQIATANDALRPTASVPSSLRSYRGSSASLASGLSSPGASTARRTTRAFEMALTTAAEERSTPWNSMPSSPYVERTQFIPDQPHSYGRRMGTLSYPPTPGASRPASPVISRRNSQLFPPLQTLTSVASPPDDVFSACRLALDSPCATLAFHARVIPQISIEAYLIRILKYCPTSNEVFLSLLVYFDRMARMGLGAGLESQRGESSTSEEGEEEGVKAFAIDSFNLHRLVIAGVTVASKFFSDVFYTNARYAKVGGLPLHELDALELQFLLLNDFRLVVSLEEMQRYADQLLMHWSGAEGTFGYRAPKPPKVRSVHETVVEEEDGDDKDEEEDSEDEEEVVAVPKQNEPVLIQDLNSTPLKTRDHTLRLVARSQLTSSSQSTPSSTNLGSGTATLSSHFNPGMPKSRPSSSGISISSAQSSEASASTITPGTPRPSINVAGQDFSNGSFYESDHGRLEIDDESHEEDEDEQEREEEEEEEGWESSEEGGQNGVSETLVGVSRIRFRNVVGLGSSEPETCMVE